ncbi:hypothetical protein H2200_006739 [Cladophialophora chaetospira]|uniref:Uncharacterized protein n=1 Tax=Cladophialophora chaetospira TaxID=386627 RepID=A0AA39CI07_9EURO|nr:hypothetical protein H2200_006739 [Cladophialophora chaetospira]
MASSLGADASTTLLPQDIASTTGTADSPKTRNYHIPFEVTSKIISYVISDGLRVSSGPSHDVHVKTVLSLMNTNKATREETLRKVFDRPLHFYVTSKKVCSCKLGMDFWRCASCRVPFQNKVPALRALVQLHRGRWPEIVVHLSPEAATLEDFVAGAEIIAHSFGVLIQLLIDPDGFSLVTYDICDNGVLPTFNLVFESPSGDFPIQERMPPWTISMVYLIMSSWQSIPEIYKEAVEEAAVKVHLPKKISAVFPESAAQLFNGFFPQDPAIFADSFRWQLQEWTPSRAPRSSQRNTRGLLIPLLASSVTKMDQWYLNPLPLVRLPTDEWVSEPYVLIITIPDNDSNKEAQPSWKGEFFAFQGTMVPPPSPERS